MAAVGFNREEAVGRYSNADYTVWDLIPRNILRGRSGDIFMVDAEIKRNVFMQPRAETKLAWAMPRQRKGRMKSNE